MPGRIVQRSRPHLERPFELLVGKGRTRSDDLLRRPMIVLKKNVERIAGWHRTLGQEL
jgi:hypothetical protein